jgi:hypothetical protein
MELDKTVNYIVSGLERSGTSMLMQILKAGGIPICYDAKRPPDQFNPKGYFELEGGKIINKLIDGTFSLNDYKGKFIKITSYGLKYLPPGKYKIIYSERELSEIIDSMERMIGERDQNRTDTMQNLKKLNNLIKNEIKGRIDISLIIINYNDTLSDPEKNICKILDFLNITRNNLKSMINAVDIDLYSPNKSKNIEVK